MFLIKMKKYLLHIIFFLTVISTQGQTQPAQNIKTHEAGTPLILEFKDLSNPTALYCSNSYSNTLVSPETKDGIVSYVIPKFILKKTGWLYWQLTKEHQNTQGKIKITPVNITDKIETYLGPPSIQVGFDEKSMLAAIPLDSLNNPLAPETPVDVKKSLDGTSKITEIKTDGLFAYKYIYGSTKAGRALITTECLNLTSKELSLEILPGASVDFSIYYDRIHEYADGNQITHFYTSIITDRYGNRVADGTLVNFNILNKKGFLLQAQGVTIRGIATCQMVHPDHEEQWKVHAFVDKFSQSDYIEVRYTKALKDFNIAYTPTDKEIIVGPFKSFMGQILPDGLLVKFKLYHQNKIVKSLTVQSEKGHAFFKLKNLLEPHKTYTVTVEAAEIFKEIKIKN